MKLSTLIPTAAGARSGAGRPRHPGTFAAVITAVIVASAITTGTAQATASSADPAPRATSYAGPASSAGPALRAACPAVRSGFARCLTLFRPQTTVNRARARGLHGSAAAPSGWSAKDLEAAYRLPVTRNTHALVAVSEAYDTPGLESYLNVYRRTYGLGACTTANGCFRKVGQTGTASHLPASGVGSGWDVEATLDVAMISAACPHCRILVVEGNSNQDTDLAVTENTAARLGAAAISNSYGEQEDGQAQTHGAAYDHPGHMIVASSGDDGFGPAQFPANLATVTAVGGTDLAKTSDKRGWTETTWFRSAAGCSAYVTKPSWQHDGHCGMRTVADVSAVASDIPIYNKDNGGWLSVAGTSVAAPLIAGVYGLAGNATTIKPGYPYRHAGSLFDVTSGNDDVSGDGGPKGPGTGAICGYDYLCVAKPGYDAPTGLGTPDGIGAF